MPTSKKPLKAGGTAIGAFASTLRELHEAAGNPPLREMEKKALVSHTTLSRAMGGKTFPSWETTKGLVVACRADPKNWKPRWEAAKKAVATEKAANEITIPIRPVRVDPIADPRARGAGTARGPSYRAAANEAPPRSRQGAGPARGHRIQGEGGRERLARPLPPHSHIVANLTASMLMQARQTAKSVNIPLLAVLTQTLGADGDVIVERLSAMVLDQNAQIGQLGDRLRRQQAQPSSPPAQASPSAQPVLNVRLESAQLGSGQLMVVGKSNRPSGAHRQPLDTTSASSEVGQHDLGPNATVRPLPVQRIEEPEELPPTATPGAARATRIEPEILDTTSAPTPSARIIDLVEGTATSPGTREPHPSRLARHQIGIRIVVLWLAILVVCTYELVAPLCGVPAA